MNEIAGRTAFITGGANGIGLGIARAFARAGAKLALADVDAAALGAAKAELAKDTADETEARLGPVSLLFNNAGVALATPAAQMSYESAQLGGGHVVNTASGAGLAAPGSGFL
jgi:NAD(P)-dependent dehydrogenase (short-subunit alcohol dehydrogenase family)